ncbi:MAG: hypothetical protein JO023_22445 [Chloroflexi bacterium]|nr:hypothetical protein [Chloroflexota bacterium]
MRGSTRPGDGDGVAGIGNDRSQAAAGAGPGLTLGQAVLGSRLRRPGRAAGWAASLRPPLPGVGLVPTTRFVWRRAGQGGSAADGLGGATARWPISRGLGPASGRRGGGPRGHQQVGSAPQGGGSSAAGSALTGEAGRAELGRTGVTADRVRLAAGAMVRNTIGLSAARTDVLPLLAGGPDAESQEAGLRRGLPASSSPGAAGGGPKRGPLRSPDVRTPALGTAPPGSPWQHEALGTLRADALTIALNAASGVSPWQQEALGTVGADAVTTALNAASGGWVGRRGGGDQRAELVATGHGVDNPDSGELDHDAEASVRDWRRGQLDVAEPTLANDAVGGATPAGNAMSAGWRLGDGSGGGQSGWSDDLASAMWRADWRHAGSWLQTGARFGGAAGGTVPIATGALRSWLSVSPGPAVTEAVSPSLPEQRSFAPAATRAPLVARVPMAGAGRGPLPARHTRVGDALRASLRTPDGMAGEELRARILARRSTEGQVLRRSVLGLRPGAGEVIGASSAAWRRTALAGVRAAWSPASGWLPADVLDGAEFIVNGTGQNPLEVAPYTALSSAAGVAGPRQAAAVVAGTRTRSDGLPVVPAETATRFTSAAGTGHAARPGAEWGAGRASPANGSHSPAAALAWRDDLVLRRLAAQTEAGASAASQAGGASWPAWGSTGQQPSSGVAAASLSSAHASSGAGSSTRHLHEGSAPGSSRNQRSGAVAPATSGAASGGGQALSIQRVITAVDQPSSVGVASGSAAASSGCDHDPQKLAEQIYRVIRRRLAVDRERAGASRAPRRW